MGQRYAEFILKYPRSVILVILCVTVLLGSQIRHVEMLFDPDDILPPNHAYVLLKDRIEAVFGGSNNTVIGVVRKDGDIFNPDTLGKIKRLTDKVLDMDGVLESKVVSIAARKVKDIRGTEEGMDVERMMRDVPAEREELEQVKDAVFRNDMYVGTLVSRDGRGAAIISDFTEETYSVDIFSQVLQFAREEEDELTEIPVGGLTSRMYWLDYYSRQMPIFFGCALLVILCLLYLAFRSVRGMLLPLMGGGLSVIWALGLMGLVRFPMDAFNAMAPILILGVGASHGVQIIKRYYEEYAKGKDTHKACLITTAAIASAAFTAVATDAAGFGTLVIFPLRSIRGFGLYTSFGLAAILVNSFTFIPCVLSLLPSPKRYRAGELSGGVLQGMLTFLGRAFLGRYRRPLALILVFLAGVGIWGTTKVVPESNFTTIFKPQDKIRTDDETLNRLFAGTNTVIVLVEGEEQDCIKNPEILKAMEGLQEFVERKPFIGDTWSIVDYLKKMNKSMHADDPAFDRLPENRNLIFQYLLLYSMSGDPGDFDHVVDYEYRQAIIQIFSKDYSSSRTEGMLEDIRRYVKEHFPPGYSVGVAAGSSAMSAALNEVMVRGQIWNIIQVSLVVFLLCALIFRSFVGGLLTLIPLAFAVILNFGVMGFAGIELSIGTATIAAMGIGIGVDYAIYTLLRFKEEFKAIGDVGEATVRTMITTGKAVVFTATSIAAGYLTLLFSGLVFHMHIGFLVALIMMSSLLGAITMLPALVVWVRPRFIFGENR